jgi:hypothetical protein
MNISREMAARLHDFLISALEGFFKGSDETSKSAGKLKMGTEV